MKALSLVLSALNALASTASAEQLTNGGFELPVQTTFTTVTAPDAATVPGWNVIAGTVDIANAVGNGFISGPAFAGTQYVDLNGTSAGTLRQTFPTTPGAKYTLSFAYANNYVNTNNATATVVVADGATTFFNTTINHTTSVAGTLNWSLFSQAFTAQQSSTSVTFTSTSGGQGGILLDGASVAPEPATALTALSASLVIRPRSRRKTA